MSPLTPPPMTPEQILDTWIASPPRPMLEQEIVLFAEFIVRDRDLQWQARVAELERDTARYRWLRDKGRYNDFSVEQEKPGWVTTHTASTLDAAIDSALSSEGKGAEG